MYRSLLQQRQPHDQSQRWRPRWSLASLRWPRLLRPWSSYSSGVVMVLYLWVVWWYLGWWRCYDYENIDDYEDYFKNRARTMMMVMFQVFFHLLSSELFSVTLILFLVFGIFDPMRVIHMCEEVTNCHEGMGGVPFKQQHQWAIRGPCNQIINQPQTLLKREGRWLFCRQDHWIIWTIYSSPFWRRTSACCPPCTPSVNWKTNRFPSWW